MRCFSIVLCSAAEEGGRKGLQDVPGNMFCSVTRESLVTRCSTAVRKRGARVAVDTPRGGATPSHIDKVWQATKLLDHHHGSASGMVPWQFPHGNYYGWGWYPQRYHTSPQSNDVSKQLQAVKNKLASLKKREKALLEKGKTYLQAAQRTQQSPTKAEATKPTAWTCEFCTTEHANPNKKSCRSCHNARTTAGSPPTPSGRVRKGPPTLSTDPKILAWMASLPGNCPYQATTPASTNNAIDTPVDIDVDSPPSGATGGSAVASKISSLEFAISTLRSETSSPQVSATVKGL